MSTSSGEPELPGAASRGVKESLLQVRDLTVTFHGGGGRASVRAVRGVSLDLAASEVLAVVGESGSGKSATARAILGLHDDSRTAVAGSVRLSGVELLGMKRRELRRRRGVDIAMVFQDPRRALNPTMRVGAQIREVIRSHLGVNRAEAVARTEELLLRVGIGSPRARMHAFPHEMSGGMCQRVAIAMALSCSPQVIVADEPTTALDVSMQAEILGLLKGMCGELGLGIVLITHDLGVASQYADRIAVMYAGRVVEEGPAPEVVARPRMHYTAGLVACARELEEGSSGNLSSLRGEATGALMEGADICSFAPRCDAAEERCREQRPPFSGELHRAACWYPVGSEARLEGVE